METRQGDWLPRPLAFEEMIPKLPCPADIMFLMHCHFRCEPWMDWAPTYLRARNRLLRDGIITGELNKYGTTEKGRAYVEALLQTPMPVAVVTTKWEVPTR